MNTVLDLYMDIFNDVVVFSVAKVTKCFEKILFEVIILFLVFQKGKYHPNKRYCSYVERTKRNAFGLKKSNALVSSNFLYHLPSPFWWTWKMAKVTDSCYIGNAGKKTPHISLCSFSLLSNKSAFGESWNLSLDDSESWICARYATCCSSCICKLSSLWNHMGDKSSIGL